MCGIAGIVAPEARRYEKALEQMMSALRHRGPDGEGTHLLENCALAHTRLSIVDLKTGRQPMVSAVTAASVVFNGEIYGYQSIRASLDYPFVTSSDTEVILALYDRYGAD
ncbi:MAG: asparagine synthase (glutamine-hydrolyzing), partial [Acidimicrobiia bacterium]